MKSRFSFSLILILVLIVILGVFRLSFQDVFQPPTIAVPFQADAPYPISPRGNIALQFSHRMKKGSVEENIRIEPAIPFQSSWQGRLFLVKPKIPLVPNTRYRVMLSKKAESLFGIPLAKDQSFSFLVGEEPHVLKVIRSTLENDETPQYLSIFFSHPMVSDALINRIVLPDFLRLDPRVSGNWTWINPKTLVFSSDEGFSPETRYTLKSTKEMMTRDQSPVQDEIEVSFEAQAVYPEPEKTIAPFSDLRKNKLAWDQDAAFLRFATDENDLTLPFHVEEMDPLNLSLCQLSLDQVVRIDLRTFRRWENFTPSPRTCRRFESSPVMVSNVHSSDHELRLPQIFPDLRHGLYYLRLSDGEEYIDALIEYSSLSAFIKRGASALVYLINTAKRPVPDAQVRLYSHSGSLLQMGRTDRSGLFVLPKNRLAFEYVGVVFGDEELFINLFSSTEFSPERFGIPMNQEQNPYRFQVLLEENRETAFRGVFMVRRNTPAGPLSLNVSSVEISLMNADEEIIATGRFPMDRDGNVFFSLEPKNKVLPDALILNLCIGLFDHGCLGSSLWTFLDNADRDRSIEEKTALQSEVAPDSQDLIQEITLDDALTTITLKLQNLTPDVPFVVMAERDALYFSETRVPSSSSDILTLPVVSSMVPELFFSIVQPRGDVFAYAMKRFPIPRVLKKIPESPLPLVTNNILFSISGALPSNLEERFLETWYPFEGSSMITTATRKAMVLTPGKNTSPTDIPENPPVLIIPGTQKSEASVTDDSPLLVFSEDPDHRFGVFLKEPSSPELIITASLPPFFRQNDRMMVDLNLKNRGDQLLNVELLSSGNGLQIFPQGPILLGLPPNSERIFPMQVLAIASGAVRKQTELTVTAVSDLGEVFASFRSQLSFAGTPGNEKKNQFSKEMNLFEKIPQEFEVAIRPDFNDLELILAPSPIAFVLGQLPALIEKPPYFWNDQVLIRSVLLFLNEMQRKEKDAKTKFLAISDLVERQDLFSLPFEDAFFVTDALTFAETAEHPIPPDFRKSLTAFWRKQLDSEVPPAGPSQTWFQSKTPEEILKISKILKSLASLTPSGVPTANFLFTGAPNLSSEALLMLLITFESYRDYGLSGTSFRIEELTQMLQARFQAQPFSDIQMISFALRAFLSQASARLTIPEVIIPLLPQRFDLAHQSPVDQYLILASLSAYLKLYREHNEAAEVKLMVDSRTLPSFVLNPLEKYQAFFAHPALLPHDQKNPLIITVMADKPQPLFLEANALNRMPLSFQSEGISVMLDPSLPEHMHSGDRFSGRIILFSPSSYRHVIVTQHIPAGVIDRSPPVHAESFKTFHHGKERVDYVFEELPEGVTVIPFTWEAKFKGAYHMPPVLVKSEYDSSIRASSGEVVVTIE